MNTFLFLLKKVVGRLFFPLSIVLELLVLAVLWKKRRRQILVAAAALLYLFALDPVGYVLLRPLESRHDPVAAAAVNPQVRTIVVLSGGSWEMEALTPVDRLSGESLKRLLEGVRLCRLLPAAQLVLSGGSYRGETPEAVRMEQAAIALGVPRERILIESASWDTSDQARLLKARLEKAPFYLVTSASHMPRAMRLFKRAGARPLAAPADFRAIPPLLEFRSACPSAEALANTEIAFYEYLGLAWSLIKN